MPTLNKDQAAGGVFFIGLGILFITGFWWPGILLVLAATKMAGALAAGKRWQAQSSALWLVVIGLAFSLPPLVSDLLGIKVSFVALLLIGMGLLMLFNADCRPNLDGKKKNDDDTTFV